MPSPNPAMISSTHRMNHRIQRHETCDSTNERALREINHGAAQHGDVVVARRQTSGRGRRGSTWWSESPGGLYLSMVWRPSREIHAVVLTLAGGLAALDCAQDLGLTGGLLKWPNDVLVNGKKLAGILAETRGLDPSQPSYVIGIGLNVSQTDFPTTLTEERGVTSLAQEGLGASLVQAEASLIHALAQRLSQAEIDPQGLGSDFLSASNLSGAEVQVRCADQDHQGRILDFEIGAEPSLCLETGPGAITRLVAAHINGLQRI